MECIVLNFENGEVEVFNYNFGEDIEQILENKGYSLKNIEYMTCKKIKINYSKEI